MWRRVSRASFVRNGSPGLQRLQMIAVVLWSHYGDMDEVADVVAVMNCGMVMHAFIARGSGDTKAAR